MGFFSKKITTDKLTDSLVSFFDNNYFFLVKGMKDFYNGKISISSDQDKEIIIVAFLTILHPIMTTFAGEAGRQILSRTQSKLFDQYFPDKAQLESFQKLFYPRCSEYYKIMKSGNNDLALQFGQIFCTNFFGKEADERQFAIMMLVGEVFVSQMSGVKKFLDDISEKFEIVYG